MWLLIDPPLIVEERALINDDLPVLDRPKNATSGVLRRPSEEEGGSKLGKDDGGK